jgi:hypothetical protein
MYLLIDRVSDAVLVFKRNKEGLTKLGLICLPKSYILLCKQRLLQA